MRLELRLGSRSTREGFRRSRSPPSDMAHGPFPPACPARPMGGSCHLHERGHPPVKVEADPDLVESRLDGGGMTSARSAPGTPAVGGEAEANACRLIRRPNETLQGLCWPHQRPHRPEVHLLTYAFWNNKGGTGKTSLCFQTLAFYAHQHPEKRILAIDVCPQANLSELLYGGLAFGGSETLLARQGEPVRRTIGGYFEMRLSSPYAPPTIVTDNYVSNPQTYNKTIPSNIDLIAGDPLLELQATAMSALANTAIPTTNSWLRIIDWIRDLLESVSGYYDTVFIDANPSFSMYTQVAISAADRLILPVMADDSSRRAIQNAFSLIYGLKLPSDIYTQYAFATRLRDAGRELPKVHVLAKNRLTQYMGAASAYAAVLRSIDRDVSGLLQGAPEMFSFKDIRDGVVEVRDFQTAGVVALARGCPLYAQKSGKLDIMGHRVQVKAEYLSNCIVDAQKLVDKLA